MTFRVLHSLSQISFLSLFFFIVNSGGGKAAKVAKIAVLMVEVFAAVDILSKSVTAVVNCDGVLGRDP